ncbi:hypothetical protein ACFL59_08280, partial [Planctomycetota bacterium]
ARDENQHEGIGSEVEALRQEFLELDRPSSQVDRGSLFISVSGGAKYPDECVVFLRLSLEKQVIASEQAIVTGGRFSAQFGPFKRRLFAGNYLIVAEFDLYSQPGAIRRLFRKTFSDPADRDARASTRDKEYVRIGKANAERDQLNELRDHFRRTILKVEELVQELEDNFCVAGRSIFRQKDGSIDETKWEEWLSRRTLKGVAEKKFSKRVTALKSKKGFLKNGYFDDAAWREWLDFRWRGAVLELAKNHVEYRDSWQVIKFHDAILHLEELLSMTLKLSQGRSTILYEKNSLPIAATDKELEGKDIIRFPTRGASPAALRKIIRKIEREVGIER